MITQLDRKPVDRARTMKNIIGLADRLASAVEGYMSSLSDTIRQQVDLLIRESRKEIAAHGETPEPHPMDPDGFQPMFGITCCECALRDRDCTDMPCEAEDRVENRGVGYVNMN